MFRRRRPEPPRPTLLDAAVARYIRDEIDVDELEGLIETHLRRDTGNYSLPSWYTLETTMKTLYKDRA